MLWWSTLKGSNQECWWNTHWESRGRLFHSHEESSCESEENTIVAMVMLYNMCQGRDELICANRAMLRGQTSVCKFSTPCVNCEADVDYTETILCDILCREQDMTFLEQVCKFVETKKAVIRSATYLLIPHSADATAGSMYKHQKKETQNGLQRTWYHAYCGTKGHGRNACTQVWWKECPAYGMTCNYCDCEHYVERVSRNKNGTKANKLGRANEHVNAIFDTLCEITTQWSGKYITFDVTFTINQQANGAGNDQNHNHSSGYSWGCRKRTTSSLV